MNLKKMFALIATASVLGACTFWEGPSDKPSAEEPAARTWTVTFDSQGADVAALPGSASVTEPETAVALPSEPAKEGFAFGGWYTEPEGLGTAFTASTAVKANITVYASWLPAALEPSFTGVNGSVRVTDMTGTSATFIYTPENLVSSANLYASLGNSMGLAAAGTPMTFSGGVWTQTVTSDSYLPGTTVRFAVLTVRNGAETNEPMGTLGAMTSWASFTFNPVYTYTVTFDGNGAEVQANPQALDVSNPFTTVRNLPEAPTKTGFEFMGWFTAAEGGTPFLADTPVSSNLTVYARWESTQTWTVTFAAPGADTQASPSSVTVRTGKALGTLPVSPTLSGKVFAGWYTGQDGAGTRFRATTPVTEDLTVYAAWRESGADDIFGPNVVVFDDAMDRQDIQDRLDVIFAAQQAAEFSSNRYAIMFRPGTYDVQVNVGFYMQILGLGLSPDDTLINGSIQSDGAAEETGNHHVTQNFWRSMENIAINPTEWGRNMWGVSQAAPARRIHVKGDLWLFDVNPNNYASGWASGGFLGDSLVDGSIYPGGQQQWLYRNSNWGNAEGGVWNMVFVGCDNAPATSFGAIPNYTTVDVTPTIREKPFLYADGSGQWKVFMPSLSADAKGTTWETGPTPGTSKPISDFYIAKSASDTAATINAALASGKDLILTPGIYDLSDTVRIDRANTVVLGLGLATLRANGGVTALEVADVDGVTLAGILIEAGTTSSSCLMRVGPEGSSGSHASNPTLLADVFFRIGGAAVGKAELALQINSDGVIGDNLWIWRADHGITTSTWGWTVNQADTGLEVNGDDVTVYGLAVEHFQKYQTLWNGNGGRVYFYQSEIPYDVPDQESWMNGAEKGYVSYKVADSVTDHDARGVGVYCFFNANPAVELDNAIEVPAWAANGGMFRNMVTVALGDGTVGKINHVINGRGAQVTSASNPTYLTE